MNDHAASHRTAQILLAFCFLSILLGLALFFPPRAYAITIVVDTTIDDSTSNGNCTLREAIIAANTDLPVDLCLPGAGPDIITFAPGVSGVIVLTATLPSITQDLSINGPGAGQLTISGANSYQVLHVNGVNLALSGVTIANGNSGAGGGGIFNFGTLNISGTTFSNNRAPGFSGGAIYSVGAMNITNTIFFSNTATGSGGSIYNSAGILNLTNSSIYSSTASSSGGAIYQSTGALFINSSAIFSNTSSSDGGGIYLNGSLLDLTSGSVYSNTAVNANGGGIYNNNGTLLISNSAITSNVAISTTRSNGLGGGIYNYGTLSIGNSTLSNNSAGSSGGAIYVITSTATITNSTFSSNNAGAGFGGGIILGTSTMKLDNTTLNGNNASNAGGAISNFGTLTITNSSIYSNTGTSGASGILNVGIMTMTNSTITGNHALSGNGGGIANSDFGLIGAGAILTITNSTIAGNSANVGGGVFNDSFVTTTLTNTIVANNTASTGANCSGTITDGGKNLQWNPSSGCSFALTAGDPKLGPLGNYSGPTKTMPLFVGSAAIDAGNDTACPATDQRGVSRSGVGTHCDIGAFEGTEYPLYLPLILR